MKEKKESGSLPVKTPDGPWRDFPRNLQPHGIPKRPATIYVITLTSSVHASLQAHLYLVGESERERERERERQTDRQRQIERERESERSIRA